MIILILFNSEYMVGPFHSASIQEKIIVFLFIFEERFCMLLVGTIVLFGALVEKVDTIDG